MTDLTCWNCSHEFESGALGRPLGEGDATELCPQCGSGFSTPPLPSTEFNTLVQHPDELPTYSLETQEVMRRLPPVRDIADTGIRREVIALSADAPAYFWRTPAANPTATYHNPLCRRTHGLWAHTLMGVTAVTELAESHAKQGRISPEERDFAIAASLLHDQRKKGGHGEFNDSSTSDHAVHMADVIRDDSTLPTAVADAVKSHMGPWYNGPEPTTPLQQLVHDADMLASTPQATLTISNPPEELAELGVIETFTDDNF